MNKYQEAFEHLKSLRSSSDYYKQDSLLVPLFEKDLALLRELIDEETPNKPIKFKYRLLYGWACPHCANDISNNRKRKYQKVQYCPNCGQKLDWGEEDD